MTADEILQALGHAPGADLRNVKVRRGWGQSIRVQRKAVGLSQRELAELCGVTPQAVSQWEAGNTAPRPATQGEIAKHLGVAWSVLFQVAA